LHERVLVLWKWWMSCFSPLKGLHWTMQFHLQLQSLGASYSKLLLDNMWPALCPKQAQLLQCGVTWLQNATPHYHRNVQTLLQDLKWKILKHPPYSLYLVPRDLFLFSWNGEQTAVWHWRHHQHSRFGVMPSEWGWLWGCNWSAATMIGQVQRIWRGLCWVEDMWSCILLYSSHWLEKKYRIYNPIQATPEIWHTYCYCITLKAITSTCLKSLGMLADDLGSRSVAKSYTGFKRVKGGWEHSE
jgi:hypothetical protein